MIMEMVSIISGLIVLYLTLVSIRQHLASILWVLKLAEIIILVIIFLLILFTIDDPAQASEFLDQLLRALL